MLSGISVICFAASYAVAFALDVSRLFVRVVARTAVMISFAAAGLFAHSVFLLYQFRALPIQGSPLFTWYTGCLSFAWTLVLAYLLLFAVSRRTTAGLMLLPTSLVLIGMAHVFPQSQQSVAVWNMVHGLSLLLGMALVALGFAAALIYLFQSWRLKRHKLAPVPRIWLPSLEHLQRLNERCLLTSIACLGFGLVSGIGLNLVKRGTAQDIPWSDPVVLASMVWLLWLLAVAVFSGVYRPARQGRKVAYMTLGSFVFLAVVLTIMWSAPTQHGASTPAKQRAALPTRQAAKWFGGRSV